MRSYTNPLPQQILFVELIFEFGAESARVRVELVIGRDRTDESAEARTVGSVEEPIAIEREAIESQSMRSS